jgi:hypothetical protein
MASIRIIRLSMLLAALALFACANDTEDESAASSTDALGKAGHPSLAGTWKYVEGSSMSVSCGGQVTATQDLAHAGLNGEPGMFTFVARDDGSVYEVDGLGCQFYFAVKGGVATAAPADQTCSRFPDGRGGITLLRSTSAVKALDPSGRLKVTATAKIGAEGECDLSVTGAATRLYR